MNQCRETLELEDRHNSILANNAYQELCGRDFHGANTDLELFQRTIAWFKALDTLHMPPKLIEWMCSDDIGERASLLRRMLSEAREPSEAWASALDDLQSLGPINDTWLYEENGFGSLSNRVSSLQTTLPELSNWAEYCRTVNQARLCGLSEFVELYEANTFSPNESRLLFELLFWEEIANQFVAANPSLSGFSRRTHEQIRSTFADLDHRVLNLNQQLVAAQALSRKPPIGNGTGRVSAYTELSLIRHETEKSRRHCRLRTLMKRAGRATQCLKPCFMMSPLAVAQFLPPGAVQFDLVVMDEASQVKPEDALGALARARRVVIVGDPKQLPPTTFFERLDRDEIDESDELVLDESESILEVAAKAFPRLRRLKWHYRSLHHSLIEFSNRRFYDGDLLIFPSVSSQSGKLGVRFHFVEDGLVKSGKNEKEAEVLASAIIEHALNHPDDSLGVGTFNMKQRDLILDLLERRCEEDAQFQRAVSRISDGINGLFIKNLENLQGDERDVIFISYTYGKDPKSGKLMQRFGPITLETGWRRLNVLVTRARKRVEVFSSIRPSEILADGKSRGVVAMKDYLSYAESGDIPERVIIEERAPESPFEEAVAGAIADMGFRVIPQVGVAGYRIDLGVLRPGSEDEFILGIECDGATYHSAKSVRDRDRLREEVIISRGWNIHRVWSTDWFLNQPAEEERLRQVINALLGSQNDASR
jgi:very-short-patch-repair endonuclease